MRHSGFTFRDGELHCDRIPASELAKEFGTPLYVYSATTIRERYQAFDRVFRGIPHTICYSVKASSTLGILRFLQKLGSGFDVVSGGELQRVLNLGHRAAIHTVFSGVGKTIEEMEAAVRAGILLFNVESESELLRLASCASRARTRARIAFRVNPDVPADTHPYISTGLREHKFGVPIGEAPRLYALAARYKRLEIVGVSVHIGSQITTIRPFALAMKRVAELVRKLRADHPGIRYVDAGGGLGIDYENGASAENARAYSFSSYARAVTRPLRGLKVHLLLEPGRAIVGPAGALLTRVLYRKQNGAKRFVITDAGMNDLIRPSLYGAYHEIVPVLTRHEWPGGAAPEKGGPGARTYDIVGPVCETGDFFARNRRMPPVAEGDMLALLDAGAYGMSLASNYNSRPRPAEVLVEGRSARLIRRRESFPDLIRDERL